MIETTQDEGVRLRLLEGWLPLAQEIAAIFGWSCAPSTLQAAVLAALPALLQARNTSEARTIIYHYYQVMLAARVR